MADNKTGNEKAKETFIKAFSLIKREGAAELLEWIKKSDFFTAPASTKYQGANEGGCLRRIWKCSYTLCKAQRIEQ